MKYFKDTQGKVHAFESDGSQDSLISASMVAINEAERDQLLAPTTEQVRLDRIAVIQARLQQIDIESIRPIRSFNRGKNNATDATKLDELEAEAEALRLELEGLV